MQTHFAREQNSKSVTWPDKIILNKTIQVYWLYFMPYMVVLFKIIT